ncbi:MAG: peptide ABC transporter substrate-binding protein [Lachnospiraceae bacterium]|nr:peptide ABC transporter substrate-binding protein [Lachnospiraceae bacterium]
MRNRKHVLAVLLAGTMAAGSLAGCGGGNAPATDTPAVENNNQTEAAGTEETGTGETVAEEDSADASAKTMEELAAMEYDDRSTYLYEQNLGEFYEIYMEAKAEINDISKRHAMMAVAEAKLLESGVLNPQTAQGGSYAMSRVVPNTGTTVLWGNDEYRFHNLLVTTELIKTEDRTEMKQKWAELQGTGTYLDWVKTFLEEKGYELMDSYAFNNFGSDPTTWDILSTSQTVDSYAPVNTYDGLLEYDYENVQQPALATSYDVSDDGLTYTFHIREGVDWVDSQGRKVADVKADDWVAGFQHMIDTNGGLGDLVDGVVLNASGYISGEITDFSQVGVKAVDDYTLEYTLEAPIPYFPSMLGYNVFAPLSRDYYTSQGGKFGDEFDASAADYSYGKSPDNIAYCGPFLITNFTSKNVIEFKQNESYWNKDNVTIKSMKWPYEDQSDATKMYNDVKSGVLTGSGLSTSEVESAKADGLFDDYVYISATNGSTFPMYYNIYRTAYANSNDETKVVSVLTDEEKDLANAALGNANFRLAVSFSIDKAARQAQRVGEELKYGRLRNAYLPGNFVTLENETTIDINGTATTFPAGTNYGEIVQAQLDADGYPIKAFDKSADDGVGSSDGYDGWYSPENAVTYLNKAIEELAAQGVVIDAEHPVRLELPYTSSIEWVTNQANAVKQSVEGALGDKVEIILADGADSNEWYYTGYYTDYGYEANYNITDVSGWGPDYGDPATYLDTFLPDYSGYVVKSLGIF